MARTTPGLDFLAQNLFIPGLFLFFFLVTARHWLDLHFATWILVSAAVAVVSLHIIGRTVLREYVQAVEAARMGARPAPVGSQSPISRILLGHLGYPAGTFWKLVEAYGPVLFGSNMVITTSPDHVKIILRTDSHNYAKDESLHEAMDLVLGTGVFSLSVDMWKFHRTITRPFFDRNRVTHLEMFSHNAQSVAAQIISTMKASQAVDFQSLIRYSTLNIATSLLFGTCVSSLPNAPGAKPNSAFPLLPVTEFCEALLQLQDIVSERQRLGWVWPLYELLGDKAKKPLNIIGRNFDPIIQRAIGRKMMKGVGVIYHGSDGCGVGEGEGETLLDHLVELTSDANLVKSAILNTLIAGRAGTATTLTHLVYFLARHPTVMSRLSAEIAAMDSAQTPTDTDMADLRYLRAVINETLRLAPQVQYVSRESVEATTWPSPDLHEKRIYIPPRTKILFDVSALHSSNELWGPDADHFDPDRFLDRRFTTYLAPNPHIFLPFGAGPRTCLGKDFPYDEISVAVIELLRRFSVISLLPRSSEWDARRGLDRASSMNIPQGLWVKMEETVQ
ncbi:hypothetical protein Hypma_003591 [Hypsizygus marmoreus]|uniref:Cytochrome P450 n=1 Tax=Hypsizygus marmoreus TaxID=39966 RepID=A0A369J5S3_HYPMA|nr:hypothetical protein Hypma_003591 [Hypsizygus marmoreus]